MKEETSTEIELMVKKTHIHNQRYELFLKAFQIGLEGLGINDIHVSPLKRERDGFSFVMTRKALS
jgi:hypothetical protein